jgi:hypothetical protein
MTIAVRKDDDGFGDHACPDASVEDTRRTELDPIGRTTRVAVQQVEDRIATPGRHLQLVGGREVDEKVAILTHGGAVIGLRD